MPANLPPQSRAAERRYIEAKTLPEKIKYLQEFISTIPEHKGNEKMRGYLRRRLAQLKEELEEQRKRKAGSSGGGGFSVRREGAAQVVILGMTGSGKSTLMSKVTNAKAVAGDHRFTTLEPQPGMMQFEDVQFQLIDTPAVYRGMREGSWGPQLLSLARNADGLLILLDPRDPEGQFKTIINELTEGGITIERKVRSIEIERTTGGGIQIACAGRITCQVEEIERALKDHGVRNAVVRVRGDVALEDLVDAMDQTLLYKPALVVVSKLDIAPDAADKFRAALGRDAMAISSKTGAGLAELGPRLFKALSVIRIYTKEVGGDVATKPIIVAEGAKVNDIAKIVHSQLYRNFKYAKIHGPSVKYYGERVGAEHQLADRDIVEIRIR